MIALQIHDSIFEAVCDGSQRKWSEEEKAVILSDINLFHQLECWAENNNSDGCWHKANLDLVKPSCIANNNSIADIEQIPF